MNDAPEIAVVGGGIGGGALATVLARDGRSVAVLERDPRAVDRVRGEFMAPWGVAEAERLGLLDTLRNTGGVSDTTKQSCRSKPKRPRSICARRIQLEQGRSAPATRRCAKRYVPPQPAPVRRSCAGYGMLP